MRRVPLPKKKLIILTAGVYFCLTLLFDWVKIKHGAGFPPTWSEALIEVVAALVETAIFTALFSVAWGWVAGRFVERSGKGAGSPARRRDDHDPGQPH